METKEPWNRKWTPTARWRAADEREITPLSPPASDDSPVVSPLMDDKKPAFAFVRRLALTVGDEKKDTPKQETPKPEAPRHEPFKHESRPLSADVKHSMLNRGVYHAFMCDRVNVNMLYGVGVCV